MIRSPPSRATWSMPPAGSCVWRSGPEGKAIAANVLKALDAVAEEEAEFGNSPRSIALAFDRFLAGKEAPGALNEEGDGAVRIMTVHASKGLEYPVVAVAECFGVRKSRCGTDGSRRGRAQSWRCRRASMALSLPTDLREGR
ncbi:MAG: 3'-5' exonuclease [Collinsella sp.]